jgi:hypothetical protein
LQEEDDENIIQEKDVNGKENEEDMVPSNLRDV